MWFGDENNPNTGISQQRNALSMGEKRWLEGVKRPSGPSSTAHMPISIEEKKNAVKRCFERGESVKSVSKELGCSSTSLYLWRDRYLRGGTVSLMKKEAGYEECQHIQTIRIGRAQDSDSGSPTGGWYPKGDAWCAKKRPRHRLENPEKQGEGSEDRCHEEGWSAAAAPQKIRTVKEQLLLPGQ